MIRHWSGIVIASLAFSGWVGSTQAAPIRLERSTEGAAIVDKVHGTHRTCRYSRASGWHRHVGRYDRPVSCGSYGYYDYDEPFYYGPFFFFFEPYEFRERRIAPRFREYRSAPRFRNGGRFDGRRFERSRPHRDGVRRRR
jgi:hypothetical protein